MHPKEVAPAWGAWIEVILAAMEAETARATPRMGCVD